MGSSEACSVHTASEFPREIELPLPSGVICSPGHSPFLASLSSYPGVLPVVSSQMNDLLSNPCLRVFRENPSTQQQASPWILQTHHPFLPLSAKLQSRRHSTPPPPPCPESCHLSHTPHLLEEVSLCSTDLAEPLGLGQSCEPSWQSSLHWELMVKRLRPPCLPASHLTVMSHMPASLLTYPLL